MFISKCINLYSGFYVLHLPPYLLVPEVFIPLCRSRFPTGIIFLLPEGLPPFLVVPGYWWLILLVFVYLQKSLFCFHLWEIFLQGTGFRAIVFPFWCLNRCCFWWSSAVILIFVALCVMCLFSSAWFYDFLSLFFFFNFIYLFIFGCVGCSFLCEGFL